MDMVLLMLRYRVIVLDECDMIFQVTFQANFVGSVGAAGLNVVGLENDDWAGECGCGSLPFTTMVQKLLNPSGSKLAPCF
jgi:hypothetical protein